VTVIAIPERPSAPVPATLTPLQLRRALRQAAQEFPWAAGLDLPGAVDAYVATLDAADRDEWEYAVELDTADPRFSAAAAALGMTAEQLDDLFRFAGTL